MLFSTYRSIYLTNIRAFRSFSWLASKVLLAISPVRSNVVMAPGYVEYGVPMSNKPQKCNAYSKVRPRLQGPGFWGLKITAMDMSPGANVGMRARTSASTGDLFPWRLGINRAP